MRYPLATSRIFGLISGGDYLEAHFAINQLIASEPKSLGLLVNRGIILGHMGRYSEAFADFTTVIESDMQEGDKATAYYNRGNLHRRTTDLENALVDYTGALRANPEYYEAMTNRAQVLAIMGERSESYKQLKAATNLKPDVPDAFIMRANMRMEDGSTLRAKIDFERAWKMHRDSSHPTTQVNWDLVALNIHRLGGRADPHFNQ